MYYCTTSPKCKGYCIFDGVTSGGTYEFMGRIPDGRAASVTSKAAPEAGTATPATKTADAPTKGDIPVETKMDKVALIYGEGKLVTPINTKMYKIGSVYDS